MSSAKVSRTDLTEQLSFYGAYHNNGWNQLIHIVFVPLIWWASIVWACETGPLIPFNFAEFAAKNGLAIPSFIANNLIPNLGFFVGFIFYTCYYLYLGDYFVAITYNIFLTALFLSANAFYRAYGSEAWKYALAAQIIGWTFQIVVGHNKCEGRKPALLDSLFDAVVMAPLFTWYEVLFFLGFRKDFKKKLDKKIAERIAKMDKKYMKEVFGSNEHLFVEKNEKNEEKNHVKKNDLVNDKTFGLKPKKSATGKAKKK